MDNCQVAMSVGQVASIIVVASSGALFFCRLGAMWDYKKTPIAICAIACVLMTGSWVSFFIGISAPISLFCHRSLLQLSTK